MVKSNEQLGFPIDDMAVPIDLRTPGLTEEQDARIDTLVNSGHNYTEARLIAGVDTPQSVAKPALANTVAKPGVPTPTKPRAPYSWRRSRSGYSAAELRIADGPPDHIAREIRGK